MALPSLPQLIRSVLEHPVFLNDSNQEMDQSWPDKGRLYVVATELVITTACALAHGSELPSEEPMSEPVDNPLVGQLGTEAFLPLLSFHDMLSDCSIVEKILPIWMEAAHSVPQLFVGSGTLAWERTVLVCLKIAEQDVDRKLAVQSVHVLSLLVGHMKNKLPDTMRQSLVSSIIPRLMNILHGEVDSDVQQWATQEVTFSVVDKVTFGDDDGEAGYAFEQIKAWICTSPDLAMSVVLPLLERHLDMDWANQWAAIVCIQACAEEAPLAFAKYIPTALQASLELAGGVGNFRVQYQSLQLLAILCETEDSIIWNMFSQRITQTLVTGLRSNSDHVKVMACTVLASYCRPNSPDTVESKGFITPYLQELIAALQSPLSGSTALQRHAVQSIICLAHVSGPSFIPYYSEVMPRLLSLAQHSKSNEYEDLQLQGTVIEAATIVGQSIGEEARHIFGPDATLIMQWIIPVLQKDPDDANTNIPLGQLLSSCARIASVAGEAYASYSNVVMPHLLRRVQAPTDIEIAVSEFDLYKMCFLFSHTFRLIIFSSGGSRR